MPQLLRAAPRAMIRTWPCSECCPWSWRWCGAVPIWHCCWKTPRPCAELVMLCGASPWIAEQMARTPVLLDELLDRASLYTAPDKALLRDELRQQVARLASMTWKRRWMRCVTSRHPTCCGLPPVSYPAPARDAGQRQADLDRRGDSGAGACRGLGRSDQEIRRAAARQRGYGFAVFAYGKLGGIELGYGSDLDLVFCTMPPGRG